MNRKTSLLLSIFLFTLATPSWGGPLSHRLQRLERAWHQHQAQGGRTPFRSPVAGVRQGDGYVGIDLTTDGRAADYLPALRRLGMVRIAAYRNVASGWLPIANLSRLAALDGVIQIRAATPRLRSARVLFGDGKNPVVSQGDAALQAPRVRKRFGVTGHGVTVGVLSDSYDCLGQAAADIAAGELPKTVEVLKEIVDCQALNGTDEGRAMMQIIHDIAPDARLLFYSPTDGKADFARGIVALADAGADIIVDDIGYPSEPMFQDGIVSQAVDEVRARGVAYFSAAGNEGRLGYDARFNPAPVALTGETAHDFDPGEGRDFYQAIEIPKGAKVTIVLQWNQPFLSGTGKGADSDLDLILFDGTLGRVVAESSEDNLGRDPIEALVFINDTDTTRFNLYIPHRAGPAPERIHYIVHTAFIPQWPARPALPEGCAVENGDGTPAPGQPVDPGAEAVRILEYAGGNHSATLYGHPNAAGAMAVGAISYRETPFYGICDRASRIEAFSSAGGIPIYFDPEGRPVPDAPAIRRKPDIVAPDEVNTFFPQENADTDDDGLPNFSGTSAAAPHAAAIAALMLEYDPNLSVDRLYQAMRRTARDLDDPATDHFDEGFDYATGYGLLDAPNAFTRLETDGLYLTLAPLPETVMAGQTIDYRITAVNTSGIPHAVAIRGEIPPTTRIDHLEGCIRIDPARSACIVGELAPGERRHVDLRLQVVDGRVDAIAPRFELLAGDVNLAGQGGGLLTPSTPVARLPGDFNRDGCVDRSDRATLLAVLRGTLPDADLNARFDLTGDGYVDMDDLRELVRRYSNPDGGPCI